MKGAIPGVPPFLGHLRGSEGAIVPGSPGADEDAPHLLSMVRSLRPRHDGNAPTIERCFEKVWRRVRF